MWMALLQDPQNDSNVNRLNTDESSHGQEQVDNVNHLINVMHMDSTSICLNQPKINEHCVGLFRHFSSLSIGPAISLNFALSETMPLTSSEGPDKQSFDRATHV